MDCCSYVLGNGLRGLQWHVFYARLPTSHLKPVQCLSSWEDKTVEICLTGLDPLLARSFVQTENFIDARTTTIQSGIAELMPKGVIDDYVFEPCGYSMNGFSDLGILTIHITPEDLSSYASIEFCCLKESTKERFDLMDTLQKVLQIFNPQKLHIAVHSLQNEQDRLAKGLIGYDADGLSIQYLNDGSQVVFKAFRVCLDSPVFSRDVQQSEDSFTSDFYPLENSPSCTSSDGFPPTPLCPLLKKKHDIKSVQDPNLFNFTKSLISAENLEDTFYIMNLSIVYKLHQWWTQMFPRIEPFYAVKCNPDRVLLALLASLGVGFDCASKEEIKLIKDLGKVPASKIIYANACKHPSHMNFANENDVELTTFDTKMELRKLKLHYKKCKALIRIRADDPNARCLLGNKYGAEISSLEGLFIEAKELGIEVVGVSFHVGSGATNPEAYTLAISLSREVFDLGTTHGFNMKFLDIGGGFCSGKLTHEGLIEFTPVQQAVNLAIERYFPKEAGIRVIAEPGRFFAESCSTLLCQIIGKRDRMSGTGVPKIDYWITDGLYGSFNCIPYDHANVRAIPVILSSELSEFGSETHFESTVFGPTCDGLDTVLVNYPLPDLTVGDWLLFPNMGAYTLAGASNFNGINASDVKVFYIWADFEQF